MLKNLRSSLYFTDNSSEFADILGMETSCITGKQRTKIFFCEPNRSDEKGSCEADEMIKTFEDAKGKNEILNKQLAPAIKHIISQQFDRMDKKKLNICN